MSSIQSDRISFIALVVSKQLGFVSSWNVHTMVSPALLWLGWVVLSLFVCLFDGF